MSHDIPDDLSYCYEPLEDGESVLRLCRIIDQRAEKPSEPFRINIVSTSLEKAPTYATVSYCWGDPTDTRRVACDGKWIYVTKHLHSCMSVIAERGCEHIVDFEYWWIDQICINQADDAEKSRQVKLMKRVYSCSSKTFVWLRGHEKGHDVEVMKFWKRIETLLDKRPTFDLEGEPAGLASFGLPPLSDDSWLPLVTMLKEPWFERVWVIQEVVFSTATISFSYNGVVVPYRLLHWLFDCIALNRRVEGHHRTDHKINFGSLATACMLRTPNLLKVLSTGKLMVPASDVSWQATAMLTITSGAKASDARDRIYSLYGFLQRDSNPYPNSLLGLLKPDYAKDMHALFRDATRFCIEECEHLWSISHGGYLTDRDELCRVAHEKVPSWVFRLDLRCEVSRQLSRDTVVGLPDEPADDFRVQRIWLEAFSACDHRKLTMGSHPDGDILALRGIYVEKIRACTRSFDVQDFRTDATHPLGEIWQNIADWLGFDPGCTDEDEAHRVVMQVVHVIFPTAVTDNSLLRKAGLSRPNSRNVAVFWSTLAMICRAQQSRWKMSEETIKLYETRGARAKVDEKASDDWRAERKYFVTESGRLGFGPVHMLPGDELFVLYGGFFLHVLSRCGDEYHHLGEAFVREYADGAVVKDADAGVRKEQWVHIR